MVGVVHGAESRDRGGSARGTALAVIAIAAVLVAVGRATLRGTGAAERGPAAPESGSDPVPRPDVVVLAIDGIAPTDIGAFGGIIASTPALDVLARDSVIYSDAYAPSPWAAEALLAALTGRYRPARGAEDRTPTLAEELVHLGYRTALIPSHARHRSATAAVAGNGVSLESVGFGDLLLPEGAEERTGARAEAVAGLAIEWLDRSSQPSFVVAVFADPRPPHHRYDGLVPAADAPYDGPARAGLEHDDLLRLAPDFDAVDRARMMALHASEVAATDRAIGRLLAKVRARRALAPIVVVIGIRAPALGREGRWGLLPSLAPEDLHVPFMVQLPGLRGVIDTPVTLADLAPTLLDALGVAPRLDIDGRTVFPGATTPSRPLRAATTRGVRAAAMWFGDRALVLRCDPPTAAVHIRGAAVSSFGADHPGSSGSAWRRAETVTSRDSDLRRELGAWMTETGVATAEESADLASAPFPR